MAPKVLVSDKLSETAVQIFRDRGIDVTFEPDLGKDKIALLKAIPEFDGLAIRSATKATEKLINNAPNLKVIGRAGIGVDNVDTAIVAGVAPAFLTIASTASSSRRSTSCIATRRSSPRW